MTTITQQAPDTDLRSRVSKLTLKQKVRLLTGGLFYAMHEEPAIGLRRIACSDGPNGVRGGAWSDSNPSACLPAATALAASWDEGRVEKLGRLLAAEARRMGIDVLLAPTINLHRTPLGGRHFECFSEDPTLTGRIAAAFVRGVQDGGVGATIKHYVGNDSETDRMSVDVRIDERTLHELYLFPFELIIETAGPWAVMASYNGVNGYAMTESPLLADPLKTRWGFDGLVMSDWFATRSHEAAARSALDLVMPGPNDEWAAAILDAVQQGRVDEKDIDEKLLRLLLLARRVGALDGYPVTPPPHFTDAEVADLVREAACAGSVLTRNTGVLPLDRTKLRRVALLGPLAETGRIVGGGAANIFPRYTVGPLAGLRSALGDAVEVTHAMGARANRRIPIAQGPHLLHPNGGTGMRVSFLGEGDRLLGTEDRKVATFWWPDALGPDTPDDPVRRIEVHTRLHATETGDYTIGVAGVGRYRLTAGTQTLVDADIAWPAGMDLAVAVLQPPQRYGKVRLEAGDEVEIRLEHEVGSGLDFTTAFELNIERPYGTDDEEIARAVLLARDAEVAVVVVGTTEESEFEGIDRTTLSLPGRQDELVRRVAEANPRTVVVVNTGAPVLLPWIDDVAAVLLVWFPGQEFGNALADMLLGVVEPGGRLPTTWPSTMDSVLSTQPIDGTLSYTEGLAIGYRAHPDGGARPLFAFGSGMGYTSWALEDVLAPASAEPYQPIRVEVRVRNTGKRAGRQVVQAYVSRPRSAVARPQRWLAGYAGVQLDAGAETTVTVTLPGRAFAHWDVAGDDWTVEPGDYEIRVGTSSAIEDLCPPVTVTIAA